MQKIILLLTLAINIGIAQAQNDTVLKAKEQQQEIKTLLGKNKSNGGYIGLSFGYSNINNQDAIISGGRLAWLINHSLGLGVGATGFASNIYINDLLPQRSVSLNGGYGYFLIEPIIGYRLPVHVSFPIVFGVGGVSQVESYKYNDFNYDFDILATDIFSIFEPGIEVEMNITKFLRLAIGTSYRNAYGLHLYQIPSKALNGWTYNCSIKIGKL